MSVFRHMMYDYDLWSMRQTFPGELPSIALPTMMILLVQMPPPPPVVLSSALALTAILYPPPHRPLPSIHRPHHTAFHRHGQLLQRVVHAHRHQHDALDGG